MITVASAMLGMIVAAPEFEPRNCPAEFENDRSVTCGVVRVPEDRRHPDRRTLELNVVVLAAATDKPTLPPLVDIDGGPGWPSTRSAGFYRTDGLVYRAQRAVLLIDQRGTGASNPLACPMLAAAAARNEPLYPPALVAQCRDELSQRADLTQYGTTAGAADLDAVRTALGFDRIDIFATSYGTTLALRYLAEYPGRVRAAVLNAVVPASARPPQHHAAAADAALRQNFADCAKDPACGTAFPDLAGDLQRALARLDSGTVPARDVFLEKIRSLMYAPLSSRRMPRIVHAAAAGDFAPFTEAVGASPMTGFADGLYLSITCSESLALLDVDRAARESRATPFGDYRLRRQQAACERWPVARVPREFLEPVRSDAQVLLISGGRDPVSPAAWAGEAARTLPHARHVVMPWSAHVFDGLSGIDTCYDPLVRQFFATGDSSKVDASCVEGMLPPPFDIDPR